MTAPRITVIGTFPTGGAIFVEGDVNPARIMIDDAVREADRRHAEEERLRQAAIDDLERARARARGTRMARAARRLGRALRMFARQR